MLNSVAGSQLFAQEVQVHFTDQLTSMPHLDNPIPIQCIWTAIKPEVDKKNNRWRWFIFVNHCLTETQ